VGGSGYSYDSSTWDTFGIDPAPDPSPYDENPNTISSVLGSIGTTAATSVPGGIDVLVAVTKPGGLQTWWDTFTSQLGAQANAASKAAASVQKRQVLDAKSGASASTVLVLGSLAVVGVLIFSFSKGR
jgi:hypothetical protein